MAITTNDLETAKIDFSTITSHWLVNAHSADASGCETLKVAPGAGYELLIQRLRLMIGAAITVTIGAGKKGTTCEKVLLGPIGGAAGVVDLDFGAEPLVVDPNKALTVDASGAGDVWMAVKGVTRTVEIAGIASMSPSSSASASPSSSASA